MKPIHCIQWIHDFLFGKPKRRRTAPPPCPACGGRRWIECDCHSSACRRICLVCCGAGTVPASLIACRGPAAFVSAYRRSYAWN